MTITVLNADVLDALREESRQRLGLTLEQSAILSLLDRVEALEAEREREVGNVFAEDWP